MCALSFVMAFLGGILLALSMDRHRRQIGGAAAAVPARKAVNASGVLAVAASLAGCIYAEGWQVGIVLWCGVITAACMAVVLLLAFAPAALRPLLKAC